MKYQFHPEALAEYDDAAAYYATCKLVACEKKTIRLL